MNSGQERKAFITGGTGFIGETVISELINQGWTVTALCRDRDRALATAWGKHVVPEGSTPGPGHVGVIVGNAKKENDLEQGMHDADVAWYLLHSMSKNKEFKEQEIKMAETFARAAKTQGISRIVYLGGLHPSDEALSEHLDSRVKVGEVLMSSGVPTAVLQAGVVIGKKSSSYKMIRYLAERIPIVFGPAWIYNRITPISVRNAVYYLVRAADLPPTVNRTFDIGGPDSVPYSSLIQRYAEATQRIPRPAFHLPLYTPSMAAQAIGLLTPVSSLLATPLVQSLQHDTVVKEEDIQTQLGTPPEGLDSYEKCVDLATDPQSKNKWTKTVTWTALAVTACAIAGSILTKPDSPWYRSLKKPSWQPPPLAFPIVWTALYADIAAVSSLVISDANENKDAHSAKSYKTALGVNLTLNAAWCGLFFRSKNTSLAALGATALAISSADLVRRAYKSAPQRGVALAPYSAWTLLATALSASISHLNKGRKLRR